MRMRNTLCACIMLYAHAHSKRMRQTSCECATLCAHALTPCACDIPDEHAQYLAVDLDVELDLDLIWIWIPFWIWI